MTTTLEDLHFAVKLKDIPNVKRLLSGFPGVKLNLCLRSATALSVAVLQGSLDIVDILLQHGADPNRLSTDAQGRVEAPLFTACRLGLSEVVALLLAYHADVNTTDFYNHSPLWIATKERRLDLVQMLMEHGAFLSSVRSTHAPLYLATKYLGRDSIAALLIRHGCGLNFVDSDGHGVLYWSLVNNQLHIFKLLVQAGVYISPMERSYLLSERSLTADVRANSDFCCWLKHSLGNPSSLKLSCIRAVRAQLSLASHGRSILRRLEQLQLPQHVESQLLLLEECQQISEV